MNKRRIAVMLSVLLITILTASGFYILTGEANSGGITVEANQNEDYEIVEASDGPYVNPKTGNKCYVRYNGKKTHRPVVNIADDLSKTGKINGIKITNTYKMFSYKSDADYNTAVTRVFVPSTIAIDNNGISDNTFEGYTKDEIDCIYKTGKLDTIDSSGTGLTSTYDKTGIIKQTNVTTYVYLDENNVVRTKNDGVYKGSIKNVFVSNKVEFVACMFVSGATQLNAALLDDTANPTWNANNNPNGSTGDNRGIGDGMYQMFAMQSLWTKLPSHFKIPNTIKNMRGMFAGNVDLKNLPSNFTLPSQLDNARGLFWECSSLETVNLEIPEKATYIPYMFGGCSRLSGTITLSKGIASNVDMTETFGNVSDGLAGIDASNLADYPTPIVLKYYSTCKSANDFIINVYSSSNTSGKVYKLPYVESTKWEKVYNEGPYSDEEGNYYIHYKGSATTLDLGGTSEDITQQVDYPIILGTRIQSTYKMFSKNSSNDHNEKLYRVYVPNTIAFSSNGGIQANTFTGTSQEIDCIYKTPKLSTIDSSGSGLTSTYDKTGVIKQTNVTTYVYLDENNVVRTKNDGAYKGAIKNVFVSNKIEYVACMFGYGSVQLNAALLDDTANPTWNANDNPNGIAGDNRGTGDGMYQMFVYQSWTKLPSRFKIPDTVKNIRGMFGNNTKLQELPENFKLPSQLDNARAMFWDCSSLKKINLEIPERVTFIPYMFSGCSHLSGTITLSKGIASNVDITDIFAGSAGENATNLSGYPTPIVLKYYTSCQSAVNYTTNVYSSSNLTNKVYKLPYTESTKWEKVYNEGPYSDEKGNYYIHYKGSATTLDLGGTSEDIIQQVDYPIILGTRIQSTYKMFSKNSSNDHNEKLYRVYVPNTIAFSSNGGIQANTFTGTSQEIDCVYKTGKLSTINSSGSGLTSTYDKTGIIKQTNVTTYVYLDENNVVRTKNDGVYKGAIKNVFVSNKVEFVACMFASGATPLNAALLDDIANPTWNANNNPNGSTVDNRGIGDGMYQMFTYQSWVQLPSHFKIPNTIKNMRGMFAENANLKNLPSNFTLPSQLDNARGLFWACSSLEKINLEIPEKATFIPFMFASCDHLSGIVSMSKGMTSTDMNDIFAYGSGGSATNNLSGYPTPIVLRYYTSCQSAVNYTTNVYSSSNTSGKVYKEVLTATQSLDDSSQVVVIDDMADTIDSIQDVSSDKIVIEDETDWISITVNKKTVDDVVTETQESSQSTESVEENKSEEDEIQE